MAKKKTPKAALVRPNPLYPTASVLCKLGSIAVHTEEMIGPKGHAFDREVLVALLADDELSEWLGQMDKKGLLPVQR